MRNCIRCGAEMKEDFRITSGIGIVIRPAKGHVAVIPRAAVCPQCGEVSVYVEEPDKLIGKEKE